MLLFMLLNPFLVIIYLLELVQEKDLGFFTRILLRAGLISGAVFCFFAWAGEAFFLHVMQARFASLQIFGGIIFLLIGIRFVFVGDSAIQGLRGDPGIIAGAVAMPIMIGPGTVSASILAGHRLSLGMAVIAILSAVAMSIVVMIGLKALHDFVRPRNERLVQRYVEVAGRVMALVVGTFAIEMIMQGVQAWLHVT
jgi:small neutral amino acid transporter SnatA (MarC family)